jgi:hypothetical protein
MLTINQGDTTHITITFTNRGDLPTSHPLKNQGFQTPGYTFSADLYSNQNPNLTSAIGSSAFEVVSADQANLTISPSTTGLFPLKRSANFNITVRLSADPSRLYTLVETPLIINPTMSPA